MRAVASHSVHLEACELADQDMAWPPGGRHAKGLAVHLLRKLAVAD